MPPERLSLSKNAKTVLALRYLEKDAKGHPKETPEDLFRRVAKNIALVDAKYRYQQKVSALMQRYNEPFFQVVKRKEFLQLIKDDAKIKKNRAGFLRHEALFGFPAELSDAVQCRQDVAAIGRVLCASRRG